MPADQMSAVEDTLQHKSIHTEWAKNYRTPEIDQFYRKAFEHIAKSFRAEADAVVLDAGCGSCNKSKKLVDNGFRVVGIDLSEDILELARQDLAGTHDEQNIELRQENMPGMSIKSETFNFVVCWGVLMHIPDVSKAISNIVRITAPNGRIATSEANMHSWQPRSLKLLKRLLRRERARIGVTPAGIENSEDTPEGSPMTRQSNIQMAGCRV